MTLRTKKHQNLYAVAAETLPEEMCRYLLMDEYGHTDLIGHILLCAGWEKKDISNKQIAPMWLWDDLTGLPTLQAWKRLGYARDGVLVVEELFRLADLGTWEQMYMTLNKLATMPIDSEFKLRIPSLEAEDDDSSIL